MNLNLNEAEWRFSISYDAQDNNLSEHRMDAVLLADAIKNVAQAINRADEILNGENRNIRTYVTAPAKEGSLEVEFIAQLINPELAKNILQALGIMASSGAIVGGVLKALREISSKEIIAVYTSDEHPNSAKLELSDGTTMELPKDEALLTASPAIRAHIKQIVATPLYHRDKPVFKILNDADELELNFNESDIKAIKEVKTKSLPPKIDKMTVTASFSQVNFEGNTGWKIQLDEKTIVTAPLLDDSFLNQVSANQQSFKKEDRYKMVLEVTTYTNDLGKESKKYKILQVLS